MPRIERRPGARRAEDDAAGDTRGDQTEYSLEDGEAESVLELLDDEYVRRIVRALETGPMAAAELVEECDVSSPTVYRRLNRLQDHGLVTARLSLSADGHHRKVYRSVFAELSVALGADGLEAELVLEE